MTLLQSLRGGERYRSRGMAALVLGGDFFSFTTAVPAGWPASLSFHDLLVDWLVGAGTARQVQPDLDSGRPTRRPTTADPGSREEAAAT